MGQVSHLFIAIGSRRPMREVESATALPDRGLEGCRHGRAGSRRQVLLVESETLKRFGLRPGQIKENITTRGLSINDLLPGQRLQVGEALLEVSGPCEPCARMDEIRMGLQQELHGHRGTLCRVVAGGRVGHGDAIQLVPADVAAPKIGGHL
jgi:MOSC domain-containing protein YiiM